MIDEGGIRSIHPDVSLNPFLPFQITSRRNPATIQQGRRVAQHTSTVFTMYARNDLPSSSDRHPAAAQTPTASACRARKTFAAHSIHHPRLFFPLFSFLPRPHLWLQWMLDADRSQQKPSQWLAQGPTRLYGTDVAFTLHRCKRPRLGVSKSNNQRSKHCFHYWIVKIRSYASSSDTV